MGTAPGELCRQLTCTSSWCGSRLAVLDRWWPSSKTCSACGWQYPRLTLADRAFHRYACGLRTDRDTHVTRNIAAHAVLDGLSDFPALGPGSRKRRSGKAPDPPARRHLGGAVYRRPPTHTKNRKNRSERPGHEGV
ncbi:zinc ribbon domain-containing protein [Streptomyces sp. NPDC058195]|uniref:zinc ribbon domain-containing protein n=1 Tax=Streptomyces sp. NPDC058195 TaxID=3346375 RepID=UPI0036E4F2AD